MILLDSHFRYLFYMSSEKPKQAKLIPMTPCSQHLQRHWANYSLFYRKRCQRRRRRRLAFTEFSPVQSTKLCTSCNKNYHNLLSFYLCRVALVCVFVFTTLKLRMMLQFVSLCILLKKNKGRRNKVN